VLTWGRGKRGNWFIWALLSALFARPTAVFANAGAESINSNLATAILPKGDSA